MGGGRFNRRPATVEGRSLCPQGNSRNVPGLKMVRSLARGRGLVVMMALHDLNQALRSCDHTLVVAEGTARACGPTDQVITADLLGDVYRVDARIERCSAGYSHVIVDDVFGVDDRDTAGSGLQA